LILENNKKFLSKKILNKLSNYSSSGKTTFIKSKDELLVPKISNTLIHSTYFPLKESGKIIITNNNNQAVIAVWLGAGYHLADLSKRKKIIVISPDLDILFDVLEKIDISAYLDSDNLKIISENEIIEYFDFFKYKTYEFLIHPVLEKLLPEKTLITIKNIKNILTPVLLEVNTQKKFGKIWLENILRNTKLMLSEKLNYSPLIINKKPVLICGAGYSLYENISLIKKNSPKLFIAATDTALKILVRSGIIPDAVFSFDAQNYSYQHFTGLKKIPRLFTDFCSSLRISSNQTFLFSNHPLKNIFNMLKMNTVFLASDTRNIGGAVIKFFSDYFPEYPVITAGIDYGIYDYNLYSKGSFINEYININSSFFKRESNYDANLLYKESFSKSDGLWKTNKLFESYSASLNINKKIYTLSTSPYNNFHKTNSLGEFIAESSSLCEKCLEFQKPNFTKDTFIGLLKKILTGNAEIIASYFLYLGKTPKQNDINNIIKKAEVILS